MEGSPTQDSATRSAASAISRSGRSLVARTILAAVMVVTLTACARLLPGQGAPDPGTRTPEATIGPAFAEPAPTAEPAAATEDAVLDISDQMRISEMLEDADLAPIEEALQDSPHYAGSYLDWTLGGVIVVSVTSESSRALVPRTPHPDRVTVRVVEHSQAELREVYDAVSTAFIAEEELTADIREIGVSISDNAVIVSFAEGSPSAEAIAADGAPLEEFVRAFGTFATIFRILPADEEAVFPLPVPDSARTPVPGE